MSKRLNMLYPGGKMFAASAVLGALALAAYLLGWQNIALALAALAGVVLLTLLVLVRVELCLDARENARYIEENQKNGEG